MKYQRIFLMFFLIFSIALNTQLSAQKKKLTYRQVYQFGEPRLTQPLPRIQGWLDDEFYLETKSDPAIPGSKPTLMKVKAKDGSSEIFLDYSKLNENMPEGFSIDKAAPTSDYKGFLFNQNKDLYFYSAEENSLKRLTNDDIEEKNPKFSPDGKKVAFTKKNNLYVYNIETDEEKQLTTDGSDVILNGWASWVYMEEILGRSTQYAAFWWSPNSEMITFLRFDDTPVPEFPLYRADGHHGELEKQRYPKAGDPNPFVKLAVANVLTGNITWADFDEKADQYIAWPIWTNDNKLTVQWMNRGQDNIIIYFIDLLTGKKTELYNEKQSAWVEWFEDLYFFKDGSGFLLRTGLDGYYHLYHYDMNGKLLNKLTNGRMHVQDIALVDEDDEKIYFHGWKDKSTEKHLFVVDLEGEDFKQITQLPGSHTCALSSNGKYFYDRYSNLNQPTKIDLFNSEGKLIRNIADSKTNTMDEYDLAKVELFTIPSGDGYSLPAVWYLPPDFDPNKKYPVIFSEYGGPSSGSVRNSFPYWLEGHFLAQNGIIYFSVDHRGSGHFGKKGADLMHRNLGKWEMNDYIAAVKWLKQKSFVDSTKIGIEGGSYGGYVTTLALTYGADYFTHGIADFSVTDWKLYDNVYTERYMDTPEENPDGYKNSSAVTHAKNYKGKLLIRHGTMDDNVHMQNTIQLITELIKLNKDFEMMIYPNSRHGYGMPNGMHANRESVEFWFKNLLGKDFNMNVD